jgi:Resolvase, N terminal domain
LELSQHTRPPRLGRLRQRYPAVSERFAGRGRESWPGARVGFPQPSLETTLSLVAHPDGFRENAMLVGYARVSTREQNQALQLDALKAAGCERVYTEKASGAQRERPELRAALDYARQGDTLVVWKLDRLARSIPSGS